MHSTESLDERSGPGVDALRLEIRAIYGAAVLAAQQGAVGEARTLALEGAVRFPASRELQELRILLSRDEELQDFLTGHAADEDTRLSPPVLRELCRAASPYVTQALEASAAEGNVHALRVLTESHLLSADAAAAASALERLENVAGVTEWTEVYRACRSDLDGDLDGARAAVRRAISFSFNSDTGQQKAFIAFLRQWLWDSADLLAAAGSELETRDQPAGASLFRRGILLEPGHGDATKQFASALVKWAGSHIDAGDFVHALDLLNELRAFGETCANHEWLFEGQPLLAKLLVCLGNVREGLELYRAFLRWRGRDTQREDLIARVEALSSTTVAGAREVVEPAARLFPTLMPRIDFTRIVRGLDLDVRLAKLSDVEVLAGVSRGSYFQYVLTSENRLFVDELNLHPRYHIGDIDCFIKAVSPEREALIDLSSFQASVSLDGYHVLIGGSSNYYHWLFEYLPRVKVVLESEGSRTRSILVHHDILPYQEESLRRLLGGDIAIVRLSPGFRYKCQGLYAPTNRPIAEAALFLRERLGTASLQVGRRPRPERSSKRKRIFVSRSDADPRRVRIADERRLYRVLKSFGVDVVVLSDLSFAEQIDLFCTCEVVIGAHGAGLTNIVFAPADCQVVEICNQGNVSYTFFEEIAKAVGQRHHRIVAFGATRGPVLDEDAPAEFAPSRLADLLSRITAPGRDRHA